MNLLKLVVKREIIIDNKYLYNFDSEAKKVNKTFKYNYYKTIIKCSSSKKLNKDNNIVKYEDYHNHKICIIKSTSIKAKS